MRTPRLTVHRFPEMARLYVACLKCTAHCLGTSAAVIAPHLQIRDESDCTKPEIAVELLAGILMKALCPLCRQTIHGIVAAPGDGGQDAPRLSSSARVRCLSRDVAHAVVIAYPLMLIPWIWLTGLCGILITRRQVSSSGHTSAPPPEVVIILLPLNDMTPNRPNVPQYCPR